MTEAPIRSEEGKKQSVPRIMVREYFREIKGAESVEPADLSDVVDTALEYFMADPEFVGIYLRHSLRQMLYTEAQGIYAEGRGTISPIFGRLTGMSGEPANQEEYDRAAENIRRSLKIDVNKWMEKTTRGYVRLANATKRDLLDAMNIRHDRLKVDASRYTFIKALAAGLGSDDETVSERYSAEEIQRVFEESVQGVFEAAAAEGDDPFGGGTSVNPRTPAPGSLMAEARRRGGDA